MNTIKERYVSREVAMLLKDKGFDIPVNYEYHYLITVPQFHRKKHDFNGIEYRNCSSEWYSAPTQAMACDWIEKTFNISIELWTGLFGYEMSVRYAKKNFTLTGEIINKEDMPFGDNSDGSWSNRELAYNDMLKYVLTNLTNLAL